MKTETRDQIDKDIEVEAYKWEANNRLDSSFIIPVRLFRFGKYIYNRMLSRYIEQIEELKAENAHLHAEKFIVRPEELERENVELKSQIEIKNREIERLRRDYRRENGFYWAKRDDTWNVAEWLNGVWYLPGLEEVFLDVDFTKIIEVRLTNESSKPPTK